MDREIYVSFAWLGDVDRSDLRLPSCYTAALEMAVLANTGFLIYLCLMHPVCLWCV